LIQFNSFALPPLNSVEQPPTQAPSKLRFGKKLYFTVGGVLAIAIILTAAMFIPTGSSQEINLGVKYSPGEVLTYNVTTSTSSQEVNSSTSLSQASTLTVDVVSVDENTYTLNYTSTSSLGGYTMTTSHILEANASDMVNLLTLMPVAMEQYTGIENTNSTSPTETAIFNESTAKVGDTWQIPLTTENPISSSAQTITVSFIDIQDLTVQAGNYKVFRIDFSTNTQQNLSQGYSTNPLDLNLNVTGTSYLEFGTCKQIQSSLQMSMSSTLGSISGTNESYTTTITYSSTLVSDKTS
jgi:hypothetical protein